MDEGALVLNVGSELNCERALQFNGNLFFSYGVYMVVCLELGSTAFVTSLGTSVYPYVAKSCTQLKWAQQFYNYFVVSDRILRLA